MRSQRKRPSSSLHRPGGGGGGESQSWWQLQLGVMPVGAAPQLSSPAQAQPLVGSLSHPKGQVLLCTSTFSSVPRRRFQALTKHCSSGRGAKGPGGGGQQHPLAKSVRKRNRCQRLSSGKEPSAYDRHVPLSPIVCLCSLVSKVFFIIHPWLPFSGQCTFQGEKHRTGLCSDQKT